MFPFPPNFNFMSAINPFSCLQKQDLGIDQSSKKSGEIPLGEIGQELNSNQIEIISREIVHLEERAHILNQAFNLSSLQNLTNTTVNSSSSGQAIDNLKQKISSLRTQLLDLGCVITAQMVTNMLGLTPGKAKKFSKSESGNNEWQSKITALKNFLSFLEAQSDRLKKPRLLSEKPITINIHSFFQKVSIDLASHPFIFTLNIRLAILNEKFSDLEKKPTPASSLVTSNEYLGRISDDINPEAYKVLEQISATYKSINDAPKQ